MEMLTEAEFWVRAALVIFFLILFVTKVPGKLWTSLGDTGKAVRAELDEAVRIRQEATDLLNSIKAQRPGFRSQGPRTDCLCRGRSGSHGC
ncbi:MAG: hypothetical protein NVV72_19595 [Asticcacaulis sp.]|nr:hypothetical protein [Asticcacaulis sp.]